MNYFPSRFDPVRHSERVPVSQARLSGVREKVIPCFIINVVLQNVIDEVWRGVELVRSPLEVNFMGIQFLFFWPLSSYSDVVNICEGGMTIC